MPKVIPGHLTANPEGPFDVYINGMRINRLWAVHKWLPTYMGRRILRGREFARLRKDWASAGSAIGRSADSYG